MIDKMIDKNCEETAFFCYLASREMKKDEGLSRRTLRVRVSSTPHPKASVNSGAFLRLKAMKMAPIWHRLNLHN